MGSDVYRFRTRPHRSVSLSLSDRSPNRSNAMKKGVGLVYGLRVQSPMDRDMDRDGMVTGAVNVTSEVRKKS